MLRPWITALALAAGALHIHAEYAGDRTRVYVLKPLTTGLILLIALFSPSPVSPFYRWAVVIGLLFSLAGDVFLMLPEDRFTAGLISFSFAHVAYILAFAGEVRGVMPLTLGLPFLFYAGLLYVLLSPRLDRRRFSVMAYSVIISTMAWSAWGQLLVFRNAKSLAAAIGSVLFLFSDSILAWNRFRRELPWAQLAILSSYYLAQLLIAWSV